MTLVVVVALVAVAVAASPPLVRAMDRYAGWPLALLLLAGAFVLGRELPAILDGEALTAHYTWVPDFLGSGLDAGFSLRADALGAFFALLALVIGSVVFMYSAAYLPRRQGNTSFYTLMTAFTLAVVLLVLADDVTVLFVGWELVSIASFMLIARSGSGGEAGSMRTLILTFFGGLTLLTALAVSATAAGTTSLSGILASDVWAQRPGLTGTLAVLIAVSAFTKAAQLPFHFWLPEAMAAATPVSAFLHAAAVVKAGVYLLLRFSTVFHDVAVWNWLLIVVGMTTALVSAFFAVQKTDLKHLTAYSTVSHLGWIVTTIGVGTGFALAAAVVHTLAHALFKSSLFMLIGVVDHQAGTRDSRRLGVLWHRMPWTFGCVVVGAASMAAVPPLFGFISKEGMLTAFEEAPIGSAGQWILLIVAGVAALLTFTYSAKLVFGAFIDPAENDRDFSDVEEAPVALWLPAAVPGLMAIPLGFTAGVLDGPVDAVTAAIGVESSTHLALFHGVNAPLIISLSVLVLGIIGVVVRGRIWPRIENREVLPATGNELLAALQKGLQACGRGMGAMANSLSPGRHLVWPMLALITIMAVTLLGTDGVDGVPMAPRAEDIDNWLDLGPMLIIVLSVVGLVANRNRIAGAVFISTAGVGMTLQMLLLGAPDVALTQFLVEALVAVIIMMVVRYQPRLFPEVPRRRRIRAAVIALLAGLTAFLGVFTLMGRHSKSELAQWYLDNAPDITGGNNIVAAIIVEFRALDTLGELSVLGMAAIVIAAVCASVPSSPFDRGTRPAPFGQSQLNSLPLKKGFQLVVPVLAVLSLLVFMRGHNDPGGGFVAALIAGAAVMMAYMAKGRDSIVFRPSTPFWLTGIGIVTALTAGFVGYAEGGFLKPIYGEILGEHLTTSLIFDGGIYLAVLGMLTSAINSLGGYLRPGALTQEELDYMRSDGPLPHTPSDAETRAWEQALLDDAATQAEGTGRGAVTAAVAPEEFFPEPIEPNPDPEDPGPDRAQLRDWAVAHGGTHTGTVNDKNKED